MYNFHKLHQFLKARLIDAQQNYFGRLPTQDERAIIDALGIRATEQYGEAREGLLRELHAHSGIKDEYKPKGDMWTYLGFQRTDPAFDIRGGGVHAIEALIYFLKTHSTAAQSMLQARSGSEITADFKMDSFPWAAAGMSLARMISLLFEIVDIRGQANADNFSLKTYWHLIMPENAFNKLFVLSFMLLDCIWDEIGATYMDFPVVMLAVQDELTDMMIIASSLPELISWVYARTNYSPADELDYYLLPSVSSDSSTINNDGNEKICINQDEDRVQKGKLLSDNSKTSEPLFSSVCSPGIVSDGTIIFDYLSNDFNMVYSHSNHFYANEEPVECATCVNSSLRRRHTFKLQMVS